jgi:hypothetical protein
MQPTERERDRKNLQDLARLATAPSLTPLAPKVAPAPVARPVEAKQGDSGIVDLKMIAKADPKAEERAKTTPLASAELFDDDGRPSTMPPPSAPVAVQAVAAKAPPKPTKQGGPWFAIGGATTILAIAAAAVLMLRSSQEAPVRDTVAVAPQNPAATAPKVEAKPVETKPEPTDTVAEAKPGPASSAEPEVDIAKLPLAENTKPMQKVYAGGSPKASGKPTTAEKAIDPKLIANNLPPTPDQAGTLNDALKQASGNKDVGNTAPTPAATGPAFAAGSVPQKPSQGAVTGALGAVMPTVRACLQPDDPISRASVVFDSTGTVTGITVTGAAAGKPAEACIKSALGKAKVQPFAQPSYTANVTIRPN